MSQSVKRATNAPQYHGRSREERAKAVMGDPGLRDWWQRSLCPIDKFMQDNRIQIDACIDKLEREP